MNKPIDINELKSIKITFSSERALDGTRLDECLPSNMWDEAYPDYRDKDVFHAKAIGLNLDALDKLKKEGLSDYLFDPYRTIFSWYPPVCDISKQGLDKWEREAHGRVMAAVDRLANTAIEESVFFYEGVKFRVRDTNLSQNIDEKIAEHESRKRPTFQEEMERLHSLRGSTNRYFGGYNPYKPYNP